MESTYTFVSVVTVITIKFSGDSLKSYMNKFDFRTR